MNVRLAPLALGVVVLSACGGSSSPSTPAQTTAASAPATAAAATSAPSTSAAATTSTTEVPGIAGLKACRDAAPVNLPSKVKQGTAVLQAAVDACKAAQNAVNKLTGPGANDIGYALLTFELELERAQIEFDEVRLLTAVLTFHTAVAVYLGN